LLEMPWTRLEALLKDTKTLALAPGWLFQSSTQAGWEFCLEDLMAWYWQFHLQVKYLNFLNLNTFVGCIGLPINFILMEKCRNHPTLHGVKTTYLLVSVA